MALTSGTRLGPFEILTVLGAGGMGEVYRAKDTRLGRDVAIKILPPSICSDPVARQRFEREAKSISALNHPNICVLHDVGCHEGLDYLVMECVEGETLAARLKKGPLPCNEVLKIGIEIANALASAHRLGLVHRDLKPANIMLTKSGSKLMDFGLAKPVVLNPIAPLSAPAFSGETLTSNQSPGSPLTGTGAIIGTIQYMAPEQLEGKEADARSDIFAFGAVLYEMATGRRAFEGKSYLSVASAILHKDPAALTAIQPDSPPPLNYVISTCLAKDPDDRFQTAHDVKLQLSWLTQAASNPLPPSVADAPSRKWIVAFGLAAATTLILGSFFLKLRTQLPASDLGITRLTVPLPAKQELAVDTTQAVVLSPDGKRLAYVAAENGVSHLYVRRLDQFEPIAIPDSEGASFPFFSPDSNWVAYYSQQKIKKAPAEGGLPVVVCDIPAFFGGTWTPRDIMVLAVPTYGLATVPAAGGTLQKVSIATKENVYAQGLDWLGDGDWIVFTDYLAPRRSVKAVNLTSGELRLILTDAQSASYAAGHLVYYEGGALWAVPFDTAKLAVSGNPVELESGVNEEIYMAQATASRNGVLAYAPGPAGNFFRNLFLVNRKGEERKLGVPAQDYVDPAFSPDGKRISIAVRTLTVGQGLVIIDRETSSVVSLLADWNVSSPAWSSDGRSVLFDARNATQQKGIYKIAANGGSQPQLIKPTPLTSHVTSAVGETASVTVNDPATNTDLWFLTLREPFDLRPFKRTPAAERQGTLSPDGRWLAYAANDSGRSEIYIEPVSGLAGRRQISNDGGEQPRWVRNGKEIVFRNGTKMISVPVQTQPVFQPGKPVGLFDRKFDRGGAVTGYDVSPDGQTFVMTRSERDSPTQIRIVLGWPSAAAVQK